MTQVNNDVRHVLTLKYLAGHVRPPVHRPQPRAARRSSRPANLAAARTMAGRVDGPAREPQQRAAAEHRHAVGRRRRPAGRRRAPTSSGPTCRSATTVDQGKVVTCCDGIKAAVPNATVTTRRAATPRALDTSGFGAAVSAAKAAAVTVVVVGEPATDSGEASSRSDIDLPGQQLALVQAIAATGKPYVVVLMNGRPLTIPWLADNAPALLEAWYPGHRGRRRGRRRAVRQGRSRRQAADVVPAQRRADPDLLQRAAHRPARRPEQQVHVEVPRRATTRRSTRSGTGCPTPRSRCRTCTCRAASIVAQRVGHRHADVTNTGSTAGDDVVQLYVHESDTSILQPVRQLEGFQRVTLGPGQSTTVTFTLGRSNLGFYNDQGQFGVEPGPFDVWVGDSSVGGLHSTFNVG